MPNEHPFPFTRKWVWGMKPCGLSFSLFANSPARLLAYGFLKTALVAVFAAHKHLKSMSLPSRYLSTVRLVARHFIRCIAGVPLMLALGMSPVLAQSPPAPVIALDKLDLKDLFNFNSGFQFRIASFSAEETEIGQGALILLLSSDQTVALIKIDGVTQRLHLLQKNSDTRCSDGAHALWVYALDEQRLMLKVSFRKIADQCQAQGLLSLRLDKHNRRILVKGVRRL